jgi:hypothetical protein
LLVSALMVFCCTTIVSDTLVSPSDPTAVSIAQPADSRPAAEERPTIPDAPLAKIAPPPKMEDVPAATAEMLVPPSQPFANAPVKPAVRASYETARQRKIWYGLMAGGHGAAAFDAWTTRRAVTGGYGSEGDPLLRPFANSNAIYAATQVSPAIMDYLGHRMLTSNQAWMRRLWWVPQAAGASISLSAAIHNYRLVP